MHLWSLSRAPDIRRSVVESRYRATPEREHCAWCVDARPVDIGRGNIDSRSGSVIARRTSISCLLVLVACTDPQTSPTSAPAPESSDSLSEHEEPASTPDRHAAGRDGGMDDRIGGMDDRVGGRSESRVEREPRCDADDALPVFRDGAVVDTVCPQETAGDGLTIIDLSDDWAPLVFSEGPVVSGEEESGHQPYLPIFRALANDQLGTGPTWSQAREDQYFELYGIPPTLSVLHRRLAGDERHACHDAIAPDAIAGLEQTVKEEPASRGRARKRQASALLRQLDHQRKRRGLASLDELAAERRYYARAVKRARILQNTVDAITAAQKHLVCDGLLQLRPGDEGIYNWRTAAAMGAFQRRHMLMADDDLGEHTRAALVADSREHDFRAALRLLRERVVAATGLIEDGSAREEWGTVMGLHLDSPAYRTATGHPVLSGGAPDLISQATDRAARALGWTSLDAVRSFLDAQVGGNPSDKENGLTLRVAVELPPLPSYHTDHMELRVVIDRGDVDYDFPNWGTRGCQAFRVQRLPTLTVYAVTGHNRDGSGTGDSDEGDRREVALVRWHTTIGGWNRERLASGWLAMRYKNSDVGPRVWRDIIAAPTWHPPKSTPDDDLTRRSNGRRQVKYDTLGPSYRSAYGLVMMIHHQVADKKSGTVYWDQGIRTHGSANYLSIRRGCSHGCHRLFNHQVLRLASFLLRHRPFVRHGVMKAWYSRTLRVGSRTETVRLRTRGYRYELTPPVPVEVTRGRIVGRLRKPIQGARPLSRPRSSE